MLWWLFSERAKRDGKKFSTFVYANPIDGDYEMAPIVLIYKLASTK